jgi:hypothetical protein
MKQMTVAYLVVGLIGVGCNQVKAEPPQPPREAAVKPVLEGQTVNAPTPPPLEPAPAVAVVEAAPLAKAATPPPKVQAPRKAARLGKKSAVSSDL